MTTATNATSYNVVLLNDVSTSGTSVSDGHTLFGNGFTVTDARNHPRARTNALVTINGGIVDNAFFKGYEPTETSVFFGTGGTGNPDTAPIVYVTGAYSQIYNSHVSGGRLAVSFIDASDAYMENTVADGGSIASIGIEKSYVTLKDCVTTLSTQGGIKGAGIYVPDANQGHLTIITKVNQIISLRRRCVSTTSPRTLTSLTDEGGRYKP